MLLVSKDVTVPGSLILRSKFVRLAAYRLIGGSEWDFNMTTGGPRSHKLVRGT